MFKWIKGTLGVLGVLAFAYVSFALLAFGGITNFGQVQTDSPYKVGAYEITKTMTWQLDSLSREGNYVVFTLHRGMTTKRMDVKVPFVADSVEADTMNIILRSGSDSMYVQIGDGMGATNSYIGSSATSVSFATASVCTLQVQNADHSGTAAAGGYDAQIVLQFTDY